MKVQDIMSYSDSFTDEVCSEDWARAFINQAIGRTNSALNISLPLLKPNDSEYSSKILPDDWQNLLLVIFVCYGVKMNDTSLNEADRYLSLFNESLDLLKSKLTSVIPPEYQKPSGNGDVDDGTGVGGVYPIDTSNAIDWNWFGPWASQKGGN